MRKRTTSYGRSNLTLSPQQRKMVLRSNVTKAQRLQDNISDDTVCILERVFEDADNIALDTTVNEKISNQEEIVLDSRMMSEASKVLHVCSRALTNTISAYNYKEFAKKLKYYVRQFPDTEINDLDWSVLEIPVAKLFQQTAKYTPLLGMLVPLENKEIAKRKRLARDVQAATTRPDNVVTVSKEEGSLEDTVKKIRKLISLYYKENENPLDFFKLILDPSDFGKTIENMLHVSFLVKDGLLKLTKDESGTLILLPCTTEISAQARKSENIQNVMVLNIHQWQMLTKKYDLDKPMIVHGFT